MATKLVPWVTEIELRLLDSRPPMLKVVARGTARAGIATTGRLCPHVYAHTPADGIWGYDFVADTEPHDGTQESREIEATHLIDTVPNGFHGVRIYTADSSKVAMIGGHRTEHVARREPFLA